jgi:hypothetical protein
LQSRTEGGLVDEEVRQLLTVERDHRDPLQVAAQEVVVGVDVDLLERVADALEGRAGVVAQVAARAGVEDERHTSRSPLA